MMRNRANRISLSGLPSPQSLASLTTHRAPAAGDGEPGGHRPAIGIIISRTGLTANEVFDRLWTLSQQEHLKVSAVAASFVDAAARRARGRGGRRVMEGPRPGIGHQPT